MKSFVMTRLYETSPNNPKANTGFSVPKTKRAARRSSKVTVYKPSTDPHAIALTMPEAGNLGLMVDSVQPVSNREQLRLNRIRFEQDKRFTRL